MYAVAELRKHQPSAMAVAVVHNKLKTKTGQLPPDVTYLSGRDVEDHWLAYPWDAAKYAHNIHDHQQLARFSQGEISSEQRANKVRVDWRGVLALPARWGLQASDRFSFSDGVGVGLVAGLLAGLAAASLSLTR
eukprot:g13413.t1